MITSERDGRHASLVETDMYDLYILQVQFEALCVKPTSSPSSLTPLREGEINTSFLLPSWGKTHDMKISSPIVERRLVAKFARDVNELVFAKAKHRLQAETRWCSMMGSSARALPGMDHVWRFSTLVSQPFGEEIRMNSRFNGL